MPDGAKFCDKCGTALITDTNLPEAGKQTAPKERGKRKIRFPVWGIGIIAVVVVAIMVIIVLLASNSRDYTYKIDGNMVVITGFKGNPVDLVIPQEIRGKPVTKIYHSAFVDCTSL